MASNMKHAANKQAGGIYAVFDYLDEFCHALEKVRQRSDFGKFEALSPTSYHEIEHAMGYGASPVRWFTLVGGLTGMTTGLLMCLLCDWDWPLVVGGKTPGIYSFPTFVIFMFELTILLGGVSTIFGMLIMGRLPDVRTAILDERITDDKFVIYVPHVAADSEQSAFLKQCGACEIHTVHGV